MTHNCAQAKRKPIPRPESSRQVDVVAAISSRVGRGELRVSQRGRPTQKRPPAARFPPASRRWARWAAISGVVSYRPEPMTIPTINSVVSASDNRRSGPSRVRGRWMSRMGVGNADHGQNIRRRTGADRAGTNGAGRTAKAATGRHCSKRGSSRDQLSDQAPAVLVRACAAATSAVPCSRASGDTKRRPLIPIPPSSGSFDSMMP